MDTATINLLKVAAAAAAGTVAAIATTKLSGWVYDSVFGNKDTKKA